MSDRAGARDGRVHALPADAEQLLADGDQHLREHRLLGVEVLVERRPGDPAGRAEVGDGDTVEAPRGEQLGRGVEDLGPSIRGAAHGPRLEVANPRAAGYSTVSVGSGGSALCEVLISRTRR